jgi:hypothetical protein
MTISNSPTVRNAGSGPPLTFICKTHGFYKLALAVDKIWNSRIPTADVNIYEVRVCQGQTVANPEHLQRDSAGGGH